MKPTGFVIKSEAGTYWGEEENHYWVLGIDQAQVFDTPEKAVCTVASYFDTRGSIDGVSGARRFLETKWTLTPVMTQRIVTAEGW
jgi:hypothetical protein